VINEIFNNINMTISSREEERSPKMPLKTALSVFELTSAP